METLLLGNSSEEGFYIIGQLRGSYWPNIEMEHMVMVLEDRHRRVMDETSRSIVGMLAISQGRCGVGEECYRNQQRY